MSLFPECPIDAPNFERFFAKTHYSKYPSSFDYLHLERILVWFLKVFHCYINVSRFSAISTSHCALKIRLAIKWKILRVDWLRDERHEYCVIATMFNLSLDEKFDITFPKHPFFSSQGLPHINIYIYIYLVALVTSCKPITRSLTQFPCRN